MSTRSIKITSVWRKSALAVIAVICAIAAGFFTEWGLAATAADRAADAEVAVYLTGLAPDDPQIHYKAAVLLDRRFEPGDDEQSLHEYEIATGLAPDNYLFWLEVGRARERNGDPTRAENALRRALELAPNYARVQWAVGNNLLRQGRTDEAFVEIKKAVTADPTTFAGPAVIAARQFFGEDLNAIKRMLGGPIELDAALTSMLIREKRYDEAMEIWNSFPPDEKRASLRDVGILLATHLLETKNFRGAATVLAELGEIDDAPAVGKIGNGGFELAVKPTGAGPFEWNIAPGMQPQIVLSNGQKHSGNNSLLIVFNSKDGKEFRTITQLVPVEPNRYYELEMFVRADVKSPAVFKWEVVDAGDGHPIAVSDPIINGSNWMPLRIKFQSSTTDGVVIRFLRDNCGGVCSVVGNIGIDDVALRQTDHE